MFGKFSKFLSSVGKKNDEEPWIRIRKTWIPLNFDTK